MGEKIVESLKEKNLPKRFWFKKNKKFSCMFFLLKEKLEEKIIFLLLIHLRKLRIYIFYN